MNDPYLDWAHGSRPRDDLQLPPHALYRCKRPAIELNARPTSRRCNFPARLRVHPAL